MGRLAHDVIGLDAIRREEILLAVGMFSLTVFLCLIRIFLTLLP